MDINNLVSWPSPSKPENLSLELKSLPFTTAYCAASSSKTIILSTEFEAYILGPELQKIPSNHLISQVACNDNIVLLLSVHGVCMVFGRDIEGSGILGIENKDQIEHPEIIPALKEVKAIGCSLGSSHAAVVDADGKLYTWGCSQYRQLGKSERTPGIVSSASIFNITKVQCGAFCTVFSTSGGYLYTFGKIGRSPECSEPLRKTNDPYTLVEMENHFTADFTVGENFVAALTSDGEVYVYDDCRVVMKVPSNIEITGISSCKTSIYCIEQEIYNISEWRIAESSSGEGCSLKALVRSTYKMNAEKLFNSSGESMYAIVRNENTGKVVFRNTHQLSVAIPSRKVEGNLNLSPGIQRTPFSQLSKEFSLNIENTYVGRYNSLEKVVGLLTRHLQSNFKVIREQSFMRQVYKSTVRKHSITSYMVDAIQGMFNITTKYAFSIMYMNFRNSSSAISIEQLDAFTRKTQGLYKKQYFLLLKSYEKPKVYNYKLRYAMLFFTSSAECIFRKQKSLIFNLLQRTILNKSATQTPLPSLCLLLRLRLKKILSVILSSSPNSPSAIHSLVNFALCFQKILEKRRCQSLLRGFNCFSHLLLRTLSCYTPSLSSIRTEKTFADFDNTLNFNLSLNDSDSREFIHSTAASPPINMKYNIAIPQKHLASTSLKDEKLRKELMGASNERRHSTVAYNSVLICKTKIDPKKANETRKAYDLKLKQKRSMMMQGKRNSRDLEVLVERNKRIIHAILVVESKLKQLVKKQMAGAVDSLILVVPIRNIEMQVWKTKIYALGLHKLSMTYRKYMKGIILNF